VTRAIRATILIAATHCLLLIGAMVIGALGTQFSPILWAIFAMQVVAIWASIYAIRRSLSGPITHMPLEKNSVQQKRLINDMAHDLRTSLAILQLQADLHDKVETRKLRPHLRDMARLITHYLALAQIDRASELAKKISNPLSSD
jgi:signal transduction histidine kinase